MLQYLDSPLLALQFPVYLDSCFLSSMFLFCVLCSTILAYHLCAHQLLDILLTSVWLCYSNKAICTCSRLFLSDRSSTFQPGSLTFPHYLIFHFGLSHYRVFSIKQKDKKKCSSGLSLPSVEQCVGPKFVLGSIVLQLPTACEKYVPLWDMDSILT